MLGLVKVTPNCSKLVNPAFRGIFCFFRLIFMIVII